MSRIADAARALFGGPGQQSNRDASFGAMLGDASRVRRSSTAAPVTTESARRNSVWWGGLRLRANIMSTFPIDVVRERDGLMFPVPSPGTLFTQPAPGVLIGEHLYSRQISLDSIGNSVGLITSWTGAGWPATVELQPDSEVSAVMDGFKIKQWKISGKYYQPEKVWHEKQYTMAGMALGLSPLAYAAWSMGIYQSAQEFALDWFGNGALPRGVLKNTAREKLDPNVVQDARTKFRESTQGGDIFIHGTEWEWTPAATTAQTSGFLDQVQASQQDICRFVGVPPLMLGVDGGSGNITYQNATSANLQFLVTELGPCVVRLQDYWTEHGMPKPWKLRMNTDSLLRMDPAGKAALLALLNQNQLRTKTELRALDNLGPYTPEDMAEIGVFAQMGKPVPAGPVQKEVQPWLLPS